MVRFVALYLLQCFARCKEATKVLHHARGVLQHACIHLTFALHSVILQSLVGCLMHIACMPLMYSPRLLHQSSDVLVFVVTLNPWTL